MSTVKRSVHIPKSILSVAENECVSVLIALSKLGKTQTKSLYKMLLTGIIHGKGVPARIARGIREEHCLPTAGIIDYGYFKWKQVDEASFFTAVTAAIVGAMLAGDSTNKGRRANWLTGLKRAIAANDSYGEHYGLSRRFLKTLDTVDLGSSDEVRKLVLGMQSGAITTYSLRFN